MFCSNSAPSCIFLRTAHLLYVTFQQAAVGTMCNRCLLSHPSLKEMRHQWFVLQSLEKCFTGANIDFVYSLPVGWLLSIHVVEYLLWLEIKVRSFSMVIGLFTFNLKIQLCIEENLIGWNDIWVKVKILKMRWFMPFPITINGSF